MKIKTTLVILIILISLSLSAQEKLTHEEMFRWFPEGNYQSINHFEFHLLRQHPVVNKLEAEKLYSLEKLLIPSLFPLADQLSGKISSMTIMKDMRFVIYKGEEQRDTLRGGSHTSMDIGDEVYRTNSVGIHHYVMRFNDLKPIMRDLLQKHLLVPTETSLYDLPVYSFKHSDNRRKNIEFFLYKNAFSELLVCEDLGRLKKMIMAGHADLANVGDNFPFAEIEELKAEFGSFWKYTTTAGVFEATVNQAEKDGVDPGTIQEIRKDSRTMPASLIIFNYDKDKIIRKQGLLCRTKEETKKWVKGAGLKVALKNFAHKDYVLDDKYADKLLKRIKAKNEKQNSKKQVKKNEN